MIRTVLAAACLAALAQPALAQDCVPMKRLGTELTGLLTATPAPGGVRNDFTLTLAQPICVSGKTEDGVDQKATSVTVVTLSPATVGAREDLPNFAGRQMTVSGEFKMVTADSPLYFAVTRPRWPDKPQ